MVVDVDILVADTAAAEVVSTAAAAAATVGVVYLDMLVMNSLRE